MVVQDLECEGNLNSISYVRAESSAEFFEPMHIAEDIELRNLLTIFFARQRCLVSRDVRKFERFQRLYVTSTK